jgi:hypothetical protein
VCSTTSDFRRVGVAWVDHLFVVTDLCFETELVELVETWCKGQVGHVGFLVEQYGAG